MLTLGDLLTELDLRLVAGASGAGHGVRWVHISELADPTPFLSGGELLLTTGMNVGQTPARQRAYLERLRKAGLSGLWSVARDRHKRLELFGGNVLSELTYAIALGATCLAYGLHLNLGQLIFVNTSAAILSRSPSASSTRRAGGRSSSMSARAFRSAGPK